MKAEKEIELTEKANKSSWGKTLKIIGIAGKIAWAIFAILMFNVHFLLGLLTSAFVVGGYTMMYIINKSKKESLRLRKEMDE